MSLFFVSLGLFRPPFIALLPSVAPMALILPIFIIRNSSLLTICPYSQLVTQGQHLHIAAADSAPGFGDLVHDIADKFGADGVPPKEIIMDDYNSDWDTLYPFSAVRAFPCKFLLGC